MTTPGRLYVTRRKSILIYRLGSLGDTVVALPCLHLLARVFADSERIVLTNLPVHAKAPAVSSVLGKSGLIHKYMSYPIATRNLFELAKLCWKVRQLSIETMVYLTPSRGEAAIRRDELFFRLCGIREFIGIPRGELATHHYDPVEDRYEAEASRLARCLAAIGDARPNDPASWDLLLNEQEYASATSALRPLDRAPFLAIGIASKEDIKDWGIENWKALMPQLRRHFPEHALVLIGAKEDRSASDEVAARWEGRSLNVSGNLSPRESAAVIQRADLFLGPDSGPMHLAASVGTPCVSIFAGNDRPGIWFPFGNTNEVIYHRHRKDGFDHDPNACSAEKKKCILSISVEEVAAAAVRAGKRKRSAASGTIDSLLIESP
jgi:heptosyltransferase-3